MIRALRLMTSSLSLVVLASLLAAPAALCAAVDKKAEPKTPPLRIVCVGDSITEGYGIKNPAGKYPKVLGTLLGPHAIVTAYGAGGTTYFKKGAHPFWKTAYAGYIGKPQVIVMAFGVNCSANWQLKAEYADDVKALADELARIAGRPVKFYIALPPPVHDNPWKINDETIKNEVIPALRAIAAANGFGLIDLRTPLLGKPELLPDGVHPNEEAMKIIAGTIAAALARDYPELAPPVSPPAGE